jgi:hypothetical protein
MKLKNTIIKSIKQLYKKNKMSSTNNKLKDSILKGICCAVFIFILSYCLGIWFRINFLIYLFALSSLPLIVSVNEYWKISAKYEKDFYNFEVVGLTLLSPMFFMISLAFGIVINFIPYGIGLGITTLFPIILMLKNLETFSTGSQYPYDMRLGYYPLVYWILSIVIGISTTAVGISGLIFYYTTCFPILGLSLYSLLIGLILQTIIVFPNKIDKILPIDLQTRNGAYFMFILVMILYFIIPHSTNFLP